MACFRFTCAVAFVWYSLLSFCSFCFRFTYVVAFVHTRNCKASVTTSQPLPVNFSAALAFSVSRIPSCSRV
jgi:hypothetical protein